MIWMQSLEGRAFDLLNPTADMVNWHTATITLARVHRFGGHTLNGPYSVAQHTIEGARAILRDTGRRDWAAAFLLHDFHEAWIGDIMTPVAKALEALAVEGMGRHSAGEVVKAAIKELKRRIDLAVYEKAGVPYPTGATSAVVKEYDARMAITERDARLAPYPEPWDIKALPLQGCDLTPWSAELATALLRTAMKELLPALREQMVIPAPTEDCDCCDPSWWELANGKGWPDTPPSPLSIPSINGTVSYTKEKEEIWR